MELRLAWKYFLYFITLLLLQVLVFDNMVVSKYLFYPNVFVLFILLLPFELDLNIMLIVGFISGLIYDIFIHSLAFNAISFTVIAYLRYYILKLIIPREGYIANTLPSYIYYGFNWFFLYSLIIVFVYELIFNFLVYFKVSFNRILLNSIVDFLLSFFFVMVLHLTFYKNKL